MASVLLPQRGDLSGSSGASTLPGNACALACVEYLMERAGSARLYNIFGIAATKQEVIALKETLLDDGGKCGKPDSRGRHSCTAVTDLEQCKTLCAHAGHECTGFNRNDAGFKFAHFIL